MCQYAQHERRAGNIKDTAQVQTVRLDMAFVAEATIELPALPLPHLDAKEEWKGKMKLLERRKAAVLSFTVLPFDGRDPALPAPVIAPSTSFQLPTHARMKVMR